MREHVPAKPAPSRRKDSGNIGFRPEWGFAAATMASFAAWGFASATLAPDAVMPLVATLFLGFAALFGVTAWQQRQVDPERVTYADVAGALTLIGICAAATIDPEQLLRVVEGGSNTISR
jgi:hypothetical protein